MAPELSRFWFRIGFFITLIAAVLIPFQPGGSAEFVLSVISLGVGLAILAVVIIIVKLSNR